MSNRYIGGVITETVNVAQSPWSGEWTPQAELQGTAQGNWAPTPAVINNSLRVRASASAYLNRTPASASNQKTWTWSGWLKKGAVSVFEELFTAGTTVADRFALNFDSSVGTGGNGDYLTCFTVIGGTVNYIFQTNAVFRDPSAWYHVVLSVDTTQATASNRVKLYVNGVAQTFSAYSAPTQNSNLIINSATTHSIASYSFSLGIFCFDGYMANIDFIDGQALTPTAFGQYNGDTGVWSAIRYTGTYGTNGFKLNFSDGTSTTTLGYDSSGNGNNWTCNNISLTAGSTYDWMIDSPMPVTGTSYGVGNYCVWSPIDVLGYSPDTNSANLGFGGGITKANKGTIWVSSGKWYFEYTVSSIGNAGAIGITTKSYDPTNSGYYAYRNNGYYYPAYTPYGNSYTSGDVIGIAFDMDSGKIWASKNGTWQNSGDPVTGTNPMASGISGLVTPLVESYGSGGLTGNATFGQRPFAYTPPSGFKTLCTYNLPASTILNGAKYMAATLYTGNGSTQTITNSGGFTPDLVWHKGRSVAYSHSLVDSIRGNSNILISNTTDAESNPGPQLDITTNGFISTYRSANLANNQNAATYVGWQWKAGGTAVSNTAGSITSQVSANTTAGFSVVTFTGTGANATVGHGLGVVPSMVINKSRSDSENWIVKHTSLSSGNVLRLNTTDPAYTPLNSTINQLSSATTIGFTTSGSGDVNQSGQTYVAYCFAAIPGYSAFGSYTGNGSTDGTFVYCGFRPRWIMVKSSSNSGTNWVVIDTSRDPYNLAGQSLEPNLSNAEYTPASSGYPVDILSNGFKWRDAGSASDNANGVTYIYAAFAEAPFANALAR